MNTRQLIQIGDVKVCVGEPPAGNPYLAKSEEQQLLGTKRAQVLSDFKHGRDTSQYTFWYAPWGGGARRIRNRSYIDWERSGVP